MTPWQSNKQKSMARSAAVWRTQIGLELLSMLIDKVKNLLERWIG